MALNFYVLDTETNGLSTEYHQIFQFSIIRCSDRNQLSKYIRVDYPEKSSMESLRITGKSIDDLYNGEEKEDVIQAINEFLAQDGKTPEHRVCIAHNCSFDRRFSHALWSSVDLEFPIVNWLDSKEIARKWAKRMGLIKPKLSLAAAMEITGAKIAKGTAHDAIIDSRNCYWLFQKLLEEDVEYLPLIKRVPHLIR